MGPIKTYFWKRKYGKQVGRDYHTAKLLQLCANLQLWHPTDEQEMMFVMRIHLHETLKMMGSFGLFGKLK